MKMLKLWWILWWIGITNKIALYRLTRKKYALHSLVGKKAIRTKPVKLGNGSYDYSYTDSPITILAVTDSHIVCRSGWCNSRDRHILDARWVDDGWTSYDGLMEITDRTAF